MDQRVESTRVNPGVERSRSLLDECYAYARVNRLDLLVPIKGLFSTTINMHLTKRLRVQSDK